MCDLNLDIMKKANNFLNLSFLYFNYNKIKTKEELKL